MRKLKQLNIEDLLSSKTRLKILKVLFELKEVNITKLTRLTELNHKVVQYHLNILKQYGLVEEKQIGRIRIVRLRDKDPRVEKLGLLFRELEELMKPNYEEEATNTKSSNV